MADIFLSYSREDAVGARRFAEAFEREHLKEVVRELEEAYRIAPAVAGPVGNLGRVYSNLGRDAEADRYTKLAVEAGYDPSGRRARQVYVDAAVRAGRYDEAADQIIGTLPVYLREGDGTDAIRLVYAAIGDVSRRAAAIAGLRQLIPRTAPQDWVFKVYGMQWFTPQTAGRGCGLRRFGPSDATRASGRWADHAWPAGNDDFECS